MNIRLLLNWLSIVFYFNSCHVDCFVYLWILAPGWEFIFILNCQTSAFWITVIIKRKKSYLIIFPIIKKNLAFFKLGKLLSFSKQENNSPAARGNREAWIESMNHKGNINAAAEATGINLLIIGWLTEPLKCVVALTKTTPSLREPQSVTPKQQHRMFLQHLLESSCTSSYDITKHLSFSKFGPSGLKPSFFIKWLSQWQKWTFTNWRSHIKHIFDNFHGLLKVTSPIYKSRPTLVNSFFHF